MSKFKKSILSKQCLEHLKEKFKKMEEEAKESAIMAKNEEELRNTQAFYKAVKRLESLLLQDLARGIGNGKLS